MAGRTFAEDTTVSVEKTKAEIETTLRKYGADQYVPGSDWAAGKYFIQFRYRGYFIRFTIEIAPATSSKFHRTPTGRPRTQSQRLEAHAQHERSMWRKLLLVLKARLEAVDAGVESFEEAFLPHILAPDNATVGDHIIPKLKEIYATGRMPTDLLGLPYKPEVTETQVTQAPPPAKPDLPVQDAEFQVRDGPSAT